MKAYSLVPYNTIGSGTVVPSMTTMVSKYGKTALSFNLASVHNDPFFYNYYCDRY